MTSLSSSQPTTNKNDRRLQLLPRSLCKAIGFILTTYEPEDDDSETPKNGWMGLDIPGSSRYVKKSAFYGSFFLVKGHKFDTQKEDAGIYRPTFLFVVCLC